MNPKLVLIAVLATAWVFLRAEARLSARLADTFSPQRPTYSAPEPDRSSDPVNRPESERLPLSRDQRNVAGRATPTLGGPDALLARRLFAMLDDVASSSEDLAADRAAWALSRMDGERLVRPLLDALGSNDWREQSYAAWALGESGDRTAVRHLLPLLQHRVWRVRASSASAIRRLGGDEAVPGMLRALDDPAWQVRAQAVEYLAGTRQPALRERLQAHLLDRHAVVRSAAAKAMAR